MPIPTIFERPASPRADVLAGGIAESDFAADLSRVLSSARAAPTTATPACFFRQYLPDSRAHGAARQRLQPPLPARGRGGRNLPPGYVLRRW